MWAVQGDLMWNHWPIEVYTFVGWAQDEDINGSAPGTPAERWLYGGVEGVYHITPARVMGGTLQLCPGRFGQWDADQWLGGPDSGGRRLLADKNDFGEAGVRLRGLS